MPSEADVLFWKAHAEAKDEACERFRAENERLRAESLAISRKDVVWYNVAKGLRARIEAALKLCVNLRSSPTYYTVRRATEKIEEALRGGDDE